MDKEEKFTAFCGLYCPDCIPSQKLFFKTARNLGKMLGDLRFEKYAELKSKKSKVFEKYPLFLEILGEIVKMECPVPCRAAGGRPGCRVVDCVKSRKLAGCWECGLNKSCEFLDVFKKYHPNLKYHLRLIKKHGVKNWSGKRSKHYSWS